MLWKIQRLNTDRKELHRMKKLSLYLLLFASIQAYCALSSAPICPGVNSIQNFRPTEILDACDASGHNCQGYEVSGLLEDHGLTWTVSIGIFEEFNKAQEEAALLLQKAHTPLRQDFGTAISCLYYYENEASYIEGIYFK